MALKDDCGRSERRTAIILIHGTFAADATWPDPGSPLYEALLAADLGATKETIVAFRWSGDNLGASRQEAAGKLNDFIERLCATSDPTHLFLIAHSHGGNVALYANGYATAHAAIDGIACLATPFLHARKRNLNHGTIEFLKLSLSMMLGLIFVQAVIQLDIDLDYKYIWGSAVGFLGVYLGSKFGSAVEYELRTADRTVEEIEARVWGDCDLKIIRVTGDEASFGLAASQLVSWISARLYSNVARAPAVRWPYLRFRNRPLGRTVWVLAALALLSIGMLVLFPTTPVILPSLGGTLLWAYVLHKKTNILDYVIAGGLSIAVGLALAAQAAAIGLGRVEFDGSTKKSRLLFQIARAFAVEVHTEAVPPGTWSLTQFPRLDEVLQAYRFELTHSIYNDARVHAELIAWIRASLSRPGRSPRRVPSGEPLVSSAGRSCSVGGRASGQFVTPTQAGVLE